MKLRRDNFVISLRKDVNTHSFLEERRRILADYQRKEPQIGQHRLEEFQKLHHDLVNAPSEEFLQMTLSSIRELCGKITDPNLVPYKEFAEVGLIPPIFRLARQKNVLSPGNQHPIFTEILWIISNICLGPGGYTAQLFEEGLWQILVTALDEVREGPARHALWALANLVGDDPMVAQLLKENEILPHIFNAIHNHCRDQLFLEAASWFSGNILRCRTALDPDVEIKFFECSLLFLRASRSLITDVEAMNAIHIFICSVQEEAPVRVQIALNHDVLPLLLSFLNHRDTHLLASLFVILGTMMSSDAALVQQIGSPAFTMRLSELLKALAQETKVIAMYKEMLWDFALLAANSMDISAELCTAGNIEYLCTIIANPDLQIFWVGALRCLKGLISTINHQNMLMLVNDHSIVDFLLEQLELRSLKSDQFYREVLETIEELFYISLGFGCSKPLSLLTNSPHFHNLYGLQRLKDGRLHSDIDTLMTKFFGSER